MLVLGTTNPYKVREIAAICYPFGIEVCPLSLDIEETGETFKENAMIKARGYAAHQPGVPVLVEDSGIAVAALGGLPGPWSARFHDLDLETRKVHESGLAREEIDRLNNQRVLELLRGVPVSDRGAEFILRMVLMRDNEVLFEAEGRSHGWIAETARGREGFGYDPIFIGGDTFGRTYAELDAARKNLRSHRKDALSSFTAWLASYVGQGGTL